MIHLPHAAPRPGAARAVRRSLAALGLAAAASQTACASAPPPRLPVAVLVRAPPGEAPQVQRTLGGELARGVEIRFVELPAGAPPAALAPAADVELRLAAARRAYTLPDVPRCLSELGGDELAPRLLADGRRATAARVLFWRVACLVAGGALADAGRAAADFAAYGLDVPPDVEAASPEAEAVLGRALAEVAALPALHLRVASSVPGAAVAVDGRPSSCVTPCRVDVRPGPHLVTLALEGYAPARRALTANSGEVPLDVGLTPAPPELAAAQWLDHYGGPSDVDSPGSLRLLAQAVRARSLALITVDEAAPGVRLRGVLAVGGETRARAERTGRSPAEIPALTPPLFDELLREGKLVETTPLVKRPLFWVVVVAAAAGAAVATYAIVHRPAVPTEVRF